jgi:hypothetical protein
VRLHPFGLWVAVLFAAPMLVRAVQTSQLPGVRTAVMIGVLALAGSLVAGLWETYTKEADEVAEERQGQVVDGEEIPRHEGPERRRNQR